MSLWAAIDIGTNSTRLLIAKVEGGRVIPRVRDLVTTRLGEGVEGTGKLGEGARLRTLTAVTGFLKQCQGAGVERVRLGATSAVRGAKNREEFSRQIKAASGLELEIFSGENEARLSYLGVTAALPLAAAGPTLVIDIGGGSTEIIMGEGRENKAVMSLPLGAVRLTETYLPAWDAPVTSLQLRCLRQQVGDVLARVDEGCFTGVRGPLLGVGVGGTITTLAAIYLGLEKYSPSLVHGTVLPGHSMEAILAHLCGLDLTARKGVTGLQPERADIIIAGTVILLSLLQKFALPELIASEGDIMEGMLVDLWQKTHFEPLFLT